jgi:hypothetical protein
VARFLAGAAACFLLLTGAFLFWQSRAAQAPFLPEAPPARTATPSLIAPSPLPEPPEATPNLSFDEWAVKTIDKFDGADRDRSGWLSAAEYASTAPPPPKKRRCSC